MSPLVSTFAGAALRPYGFTLGGAAPAAFELISTQVLTSTATSITFSSISSNFKHLQIRVVARDTGNPSQSYMAIPMTFNSDSATNYDLHVLLGQGTSVVSSASNTRNNILIYGMATAYAATSNYTGGIVDILDYATNKNKTTRALTGIKDTQSAVYLSSGLWRSTSAISSITLTAPTTAFAIGSRFSLYGVRGS